MVNNTCVEGGSHDAIATVIFFIATKLVIKDLMQVFTWCNGDNSTYNLLFEINKSQSQPHHVNKNAFQ